MIYFIKRDRHESQTSMIKEIFNIIMKWINTEIGRKLTT